MKNQPKPNKHYYLYKIVNKVDGSFYFGVRGCDEAVNPEHDLGVVYFTSGRLKKAYKAIPESYDKFILEIFKKKYDALKAESLIIQANLSNPMCKNLTYDKAAYYKAISPDAYFHHKRRKKKEERQEELKQVRIEAKVKSNERLKKTLESYFDESLGCVVHVYPTAGKKGGRK
jgi:hypothetical protein